MLRSNDQINLVCSHDVSNENKQIGLRMRIEVVVGIGDAKPKNENMPAGGYAVYGG